MTWLRNCFALMFIAAFVAGCSMTGGSTPLPSEPTLVCPVGQVQVQHPDNSDFPCDWPEKSALIDVDVDVDLQGGRAEATEWGVNFPAGAVHVVIEMSRESYDLLLDQAALSRDVASTRLLLSDKTLASLVPLDTIKAYTAAQKEELDEGGPITDSALKDNSIQVGLLFTGSSVIDPDFQLLTDDKGLQPADDAIADREHQNPCSGP